LTRKTRLGQAVSIEEIACSSDIGGMGRDWCEEALPQSSSACAGGALNGRGGGCGCVKEWKKRTFSDRIWLSQLAKNVGNATALPMMAAHDQAMTKTAVREGFMLQSISGD
jgi:hypothetical protein